MNERERIELLMKCYELTPSQFAEKTGIQRASVSHILSGRNKPSLEVLQKIYEAFPELDIKWLMTSAGEEPVAATKRNETAPLSVENSLFSQPEQPGLHEPAQIQHIVQPRPEPIQQRPAKPQSQPRVVVERQPRRTAVVRTQQQPVNERRIKEIRIFYTDGTYETLFPEK